MTEDKKITPTDALKKAEELIEELKKQKDSQSKKYEYEGVKYDEEGLIQKMTEEYIEEGSSKEEARKKAEKVIFHKKWDY
jgi:hypothetical protein